MKSVFFTFSDKGELRNSKISESVIFSDKRLTYEQAGLFLKENDISKIRSAKPPPSRYSGNPGKPLDQLDDTFLDNLQTMEKIFCYLKHPEKLDLKKNDLNSHKQNRIILYIFILILFLFSEKKVLLETNCKFIGLKKDVRIF